MNIFQQRVKRIKNLPSRQLEKHFHYSNISVLVLGLFLAAGIGIQIYFVPATPQEFIVSVVLGSIVAAALLVWFSHWSMVLKFIILAWVGMYFNAHFNFYPIFTLLTLGLLISPGFQLVDHWDKVVILRFGRFKRVRDSGLFLLWPLVEKIASFVDTRIRATDFSAERTITKDTVPVDVDGLTFWMIWDAQKAILEVENYIEAVTLSAQTALRDAIGKHTLAELLSERDKIASEIQKILDAKTNPWGISILTIEFTDIIIPNELEDAMSKQAQAERERQSRVILSSAEIEIAKKFQEAAKSYENSETALRLRAMNMIYEGIRQKGSLMLIPSSALDSMNIGTIMGSLALNKTREQETKSEPEVKEDEPKEK